MSRLKQITPFVPVNNLDNSVQFFEAILGFECTFKADNYAFIRRDSAALRIIEVDAHVDMKDEKREQSCYIDVEDIDALYKELKPKLDLLPAGRVRAPFNQDYGQREFHVKDEDALLVFFGEGIN